MKHHEEELQDQIESGKLKGNETLDAQAYQQVFQALSREPEFQLKADFADRLVSTLGAKKRKAEVRDYAWLVFGVLFLVTGFIVAIVATSTQLTLGFLKEMSAYSGLLIFVLTFLVGLNWLDRRLFKESGTAEKLFS